MTEVSADGVRLKDGRLIASNTVIWAAGVRPSLLTANLPVKKAADGRLMVDQHLRLLVHPEVYAIGDCAWFPVPAEGGRSAPANAHTAVREARTVARNIAADLRRARGAHRAFVWRQEGNLITLGQGDGVLNILGVRLEGFPAWLLWRGFYLSQLLGFKNRLGVLVNWFSAYFLRRDTAKLDVVDAVHVTTDEPPPARVASHHHQRHHPGAVTYQPDLPLSVRF